MLDQRQVLRDCYVVILVSTPVGVSAAVTLEAATVTSIVPRSAQQITRLGAGEQGQS